jgi:hypothetical protein
MQEEFGIPSEKSCWIGQGSGQADDQAIQREARVQASHDAQSPDERDRMEFIAKIVRAGLGGTGDPPENSLAHDAEGLVGPKPTFELCAGWLTLLPTEEWTQSLSVRWFSDAEKPPLDQGQEAMLAFFRHRINEKRNLKSFSLYVGDTLQNVLRVGDTLRFSRNELGALSYFLERNREVILSAGRLIDEGGPVALWQEYDSRPNPNAGQKIRGRPVAEHIRVIRPYVSARVHDQVFHLVAGQDAYVDP